MSMVISGDNGLTFPAGSTQVQAGNYQTMVNRIINGRMEIDQRNAGASVTPASGAYTLDRWMVEASQASKFSVQQNAGSVTPPAGFTNYLGVTSLAATSLGAGDYFILEQRVEGFNTADLDFGKSTAKTITISFWVRSSLTGTFGGVVGNIAGTRSYPFSYTISSANTWEYKTVTIAGDNTGTWPTNNTAGLVLYFGLGVGSTYSAAAGAWVGALEFSATGATSVVGTNGATFYITGVDLRVGSYTVVPQDFRAYGTELALCQRYYYLLGKGNAITVANAYYHGSTQIRTVINFPVQMRGTPTLVSTSGTDYYWIERSAGADYFNSFDIYRPSIYSSAIYNSSEVSGTDGFSGNITFNNAASSVAFNAEL